MARSLVPDDFLVPAGLAFGGLRLRMLTVHDVVKDYDAVIASTAQLLELLPGWRGWPVGLTLEQNLIDLGWHQKEFQRRRSFAYTVVTEDETRVMGCVYLYPPTRGDFAAEVYLWARASAQGDEADLALEQAVKSWLARDWPFSNVVYPGRSISWADWEALAAG